MSYPNLLTPEEMLAQAAERLGLPEIVAICGSTRFMDLMAAEDQRLTWEGRIVVKPGCDMKTPHPMWADPVEAEAGKARLDELHRAKIRLAKWVLVVGDYVGDSTRAEIAYARELGKRVEFTHPEVDPDGGEFAAMANMCPAVHGTLGRICELPAGHEGMHTGASGSSGTVWEGDAS